MQNKRLLQDIGLNAYEAAVYRSLLKYGVSEANILCRDAEVPYGKIYTILEELTRKGFVEIQATRPKKFRMVDPAIALDSFFEKRKVESERKIEVLKNSIEETKQALRSVPTQKLKDEVFWTTAITESEIEKLVFSIYGGAKKSIRAIPSTVVLPHVSNLLPEILKAIDRGVKIKLLITPRRMNIVPVYIKQVEKALDKFKKAIEIRIAKNLNSSFLVIDDSVVVLLQLHPTDNDRVLSIVKILDTGLAKNLAEEYDSLWHGGEQLGLQEFTKERELHKLGNV